MLKRKARRWNYLTLEQVKEFGRREDTESIWHGALEGPDLTTTDRLAGRSLRLRFEDGPVWEYEFLSERRLRWRASDGRGGEDVYNASPAPGYADILFLHHYCGGEIPSCADVFLDLERGCAVLFDAALGLPANPREITRRILFGSIDGMPPCPEEDRPRFTDDLTGKVISWSRPGSARKGIKYIFSSCCYLTYVMRFADGTCWMATHPCDYIRLRGDLYVCSTIEERQAGVELVMLMNLTLLTDVQTEFGIGVPREGEDRLETAMHSGRQGSWDNWETDLFSE